MTQKFLQNYGVTELWCYRITDQYSPTFSMQGNKCTDNICSKSRAKCLPKILPLCFMTQSILIEKCVSINLQIGQLHVFQI